MSFGGSTWFCIGQPFAQNVETRFSILKEGKEYFSMLEDEDSKRDSKYQIFWRSKEKKKKLALGWEWEILQEVWLVGWNFCGYANNKFNSKLSNWMEIRNMDYDLWHSLCVSVCLFVYAVDAMENTYSIACKILYLPDVGFSSSSSSPLMALENSQLI